LIGCRNCNETPYCPCCHQSETQEGDWELPTAARSLPHPPHSFCLLLRHVEPHDPLTGGPCSPIDYAAIPTSSRDPRDGRQRGGVRGEMHKISAGKFHFQPPSLHSITSSARASTVGGISSLSAFAVLRLMTSSYLVGACTGRSAGFSPLRMRST